MVQATTENGIKTNFQHITKSPEILAEFIANTVNDALFFLLSNHYDSDYFDDGDFYEKKNDWVEWLRQECEVEE